MFLRRGYILGELPIVNVYLARERARRGDRDEAIPLMRAAVDHLFREGQLLEWGIPATGVLVETLLDRGADGDVAEAEAAIERLAAAPAEEGLVIRDIWLLRLRALLARAHGDDAGLSRLSGSLPRHGENAWLRGTYRVGRGDAMTAGVSVALLIPGVGPSWRCASGTPTSEFVAGPQFRTQPQLSQKPVLGFERSPPLRPNVLRVAPNRRVHGLAGTPAAVVVGCAPATRMRSSAAASVLACHGSSDPSQYLFAWGMPPTGPRPGYEMPLGGLSPPNFSCAMQFGDDRLML